MKRNKLFAATSLSALRKPYRWIITAVVFLLIFITSVGSANAQSKDRDNPTRLTSNEISGLTGPSYRGDNYHYTFVAGPGELTITLSAEATERYSLNQVGFDLFDKDANKVGQGFITASLGKTEQIIKRITIPHRQSVLLRIWVSHDSDSGRYRLRLSGAVNFNDSSTGIGGIGDVTRETETRLYRPDCLPQKGKLLIIMKDGSSKEIDLSETEMIRVLKDKKD